MGIFALGDINDDGALDLDEFIAVMCPSALSVVSRLVGKYKNISEVKKAFLAIDVNKDGLLSKDELAGSGKFNAQEVEAIFILGDLSGDGDIDLEEFVSLLCPMAGMAIARLTRNVNNISDAQQLFRILDKDGDGNISQEEMRACGSRFNAQEIEAIYAEGDHCSCSFHHQDQDHCSTREEVLCLDRRIHPCFPLHLPADVDLQAGV